MTQLDKKDRQLLHLLQRDANKPATVLSEELHLSASQIGRRRQRLETEGYISATTCRLNAAKIGLGVQAFVQVQTAAHSGQTHTAFKRLTETQPEIVAAWTMTGEADYMLRVFCKDLAALNDLVQNVLLPHPSVGRVQSQIVMQELKDQQALPVL